MSGFVFYDGPSILDGSPIIGIAVTSKSRNGKTGDVIQTYVIRADIDPVSALKTGDDESVCGDCIHRPQNGGSCYVDVPKSVLAVFSAWIRGAYPLATPDQMKKLARSSRRKARMGSYGDPVAIPSEAWQWVKYCPEGHTGYSHQWKLAIAQSLRDLLMASADSASERDLARAMGWRTFRVRTAEENLGPREAICPASEEAGKRRTCSTCGACDGTARGESKASIAIIVHGSKAKRFIPIVAA